MYEHLNKFYIVGVDIGGTPITAALTDAATGLVIEETIAGTSRQFPWQHLFCGSPISLWGS
ncbi:MAG: ROK family protein [Ferruginibacter sp.]|nr:ROK family protein [Ferruginibacter sp.]